MRLRVALPHTSLRYIQTYKYTHKHPLQKHIFLFISWAYFDLCLISWILIPPPFVHKANCIKKKRESLWYIVYQNNIMFHSIVCHCSCAKLKSSIHPKRICLLNLIYCIEICLIFVVECNKSLPTKPALPVPYNLIYCCWKRSLWT